MQFHHSDERVSTSVSSRHRSPNSIRSLAAILRHRRNRRSERSRSFSPPIVFVEFTSGSSGELELRGIGLADPRHDLVRSASTFPATPRHGGAHTERRAPLHQSEPVRVRRIGATTRMCSHGDDSGPRMVSPRPWARPTSNFCKLYFDGTSVESGELDCPRRLRFQHGHHASASCFFFFSSAPGVLRAFWRWRRERHAIANWEGLTRFIDNPFVPLDNNGTERAITAPVVGTKNHYGSKSKRGAEAAATLYSLMETAKLHDVDPTCYLREAVRAANRGEALLPWNPAATAAGCAAP